MVDPASVSDIKSAVPPRGTSPTVMDTADTIDVSITSAPHTSRWCELNIALINFEYTENAASDDTSSFDCGELFVEEDDNNCDADDVDPITTAEE